MNKNNIRNRNYNLILYPEDTSHKHALEIIKKSFKYAYILHDKDIADIDTGEIKKEHWHVIITFSNARSLKQVASDLEISDNYIQPCNDLDSSLLYLVHFYEDDKAKYDVNDVVGPLQKRLIRLINTDNKNESERVKDVFSFIDSQQVITDKELINWACDNGYWSEFRRAYNIFKDYKYQHNCELSFYSSVDSIQEKGNHYEES